MSETDWTVGWGRGVTGGNTPAWPLFAAEWWPYTIVRDGDETVAIVPARNANREMGSPSKAIVGSEIGRAHLFAAAPDLYRELHHLVTLLREQERDGFRDIPGLATLNGARAALRKARGEE